MKKILSIFLCLTMVFLMCSCAKQDGTETTAAPETSKILRVGFGRADISPEISVPLYGYGNHNDRFSTHVMDPIYATCVAFTDENDNTVLIFHQDLTSSFSLEAIMARNKVAKAVGLTADQVYVSATHMHSGPALSVENPAMEVYLEFYYQKLVDAAKEAMADRKPAEMYTATTHPVGLNFVRHYVMNDGSIIGDNFGTAAGKTYTGHVWDADNTMQLIKFVREDAKDIVLVNWQAHPHRNAGAQSTHVTSDLVGAFRDYFEAETDCLFAYFNGGGGNINSASRMSEENAASNYIEHGQQMAQYAIMACDNMTKVKTGNVQTVKNKYDVTSAKNVHNIQMYAFSIGDVGFICAPYEMFDVNAIQIREGSPFEMTFVVCYTGGGNGYIGAEQSYAYGGYEVEYHGYPKGTAEILANMYVDMLKSLYPTK